MVRLSFSLLQQLSFINSIKEDSTQADAPRVQLQGISSILSVPT